jgi:HSP20 family protein
MPLYDLMNLEQPFGLPFYTGRNFSRFLLSMQDDMNQMMHAVLEDDKFPISARLGAGFPPVNVVEKDGQYKVRVELNGLEPEDINVSVDNGVMTIEGERQDEQKEEDREGSYIRREISYGAFSRSIPLSDAADSEQSKATFKNGILTVEVPKRSDAAQKSKKIKISTAADGESEEDVSSRERKSRPAPKTAKS